MKRRFLTLAVILFLFISTFGQKRHTEIGIKLINELCFSNLYAWGAGAQLVLPFSAKSSIETGLYFKTRPFQYYPSLPNTLELLNVVVTERNILFPLFYRFDSRKINFTIGPALEYFIGWKQNERRSEVKVDDYSTEKFELISTASLSRNFNLKNNWIFEPELRFSAFVPNGDGGYSLNFSFRKKLR